MLHMSTLATALSPKDEKFNAQHRWIPPLQIAQVLEPSPLYSGRQSVGFWFNRPSITRAFFRRQACSEGEVFVFVLLARSNARSTKHQEGVTAGDRR